jgi:hypothetical protein
MRSIGGTAVAADVRTAVCLRRETTSDGDERDRTRLSHAGVVRRERCCVRFNGTASVVNHGHEWIETVRYVSVMSDPDPTTSDCG